MINSSKQYIFLFFLVSVPLGNQKAMDDFSWDYPAVENLIDNTNFETATRAPVPVSDIIALLNQFGVIDLLQENLYDKSYPLNKRYILDLPLFTFPWYHSRCKELGYQFFYNATNKMTFAKECNKISAYLAIAGNGFIEKLQTSLQEIASVYPNFDPNMALELLTLFEHFTVQDRSLGIMFDGEKKINDARLRWFLPVYLHERNHFVTPAVQKAINRILDPYLGTPSTDEQMAFAEEFLIEDQLGFGDFRLECDFPLIETETFKARVGFMADFPIAFPWTYGLIGSKFRPPCVRPILDIQELVAEIVGGGAVTDSNAQSFIIQAFNNLSAILLNTSLGHDGHPGIGIMWRTKSSLTKFVSRPWAENIYFQSRMSFEYLLPNTEYRAFVPKNNAAAFENHDFTSDDPTVAQQNLIFLEQTLTNRLFPPFIYAMVFPGIVIRSTSRAVYEGPVWGCFVGSDMWIRTKEHITTLESSAAVFNSLEIANAERPLAYQSKMFAGIVHRVCFVEDREWAFSLNADTTVLRSGVGEDFTITLNIDLNF